MTTSFTSGRTNLALAAAFAVIAAAGAAPAIAKSHAAKEVACYGINSCKGTSDCKTAHNDCKGMNSCKGEGFIHKTEAACAKAGGSLTPKA
jgi:uncharacterized membrane protein